MLKRSHNAILNQNLWNTQSKFMFIYTDRVCLVEMEQLHSCYCEIVDRYLQSLCRTPCWWPSLVPDECLVISDARQLIVCMAWKYQTSALPKRQLVLCFANWPACISCALPSKKLQMIPVVKSSHWSRQHWWICWSVLVVTNSY